MHPSARQVQRGSIDRKHPMPLPPPVRVGPDFPCVPGSAFGVEDHLEDFLMQGLEQLLGQRGRISWTPLREHQPENEQHDHQHVQHAPPPLPEPVMPVGDTYERLDDAAPEPDKSILRGAKTATGGLRERRPDRGEPVSSTCFQSFVSGYR